jgi:hypothetical protein
MGDSDVTVTIRAEHLPGVTRSLLLDMCSLADGLNHAADRSLGDTLTAGTQVTELLAVLAQLDTGDADATVTADWLLLYRLFNEVQRDAVLVLDDIDRNLSTWSDPALARAEALQARDSAERAIEQLAGAVTA